ncbi:MAG: SUMF1/EgtB/PvdO family nonheme iron enzyme [Bryobacteraceae bacterium]
MKGPTHIGSGVQRYDRAATAAYPSYWWQRLFELFEWKPASRAPFRRSVAFLAGVSTYENNSLPRLKWVPSDIASLRDFLLTDGGFDTVLELREENVTRSTIEDYMATKFTSASSLLGPEDRLLFYYSGHGADQLGKIGYLQFRKAAPGSFSGDHVLPVRDFQRWAAVNVAKHLLVVLDACASGLAVVGKSPPNAEALLASLSGEGSGFLVTAGSGAQSVYQYQINERQGYSVLTRALLDALRARAAFAENPGFLTIHQVFGQAELDVKRFEAQQGKKMDPQLWELERGDGLRRGTFVFLNGNGGKPSLPDRYSGTITVAKTGARAATSDNVLLAAYQLVEFSRHVPTLQAFVDQYRDTAGAGPFVESIKFRIQDMQQAAASAPAESSRPTPTAESPRRSGVGLWNGPELSAAKSLIAMIDIDSDGRHLQGAGIVFGASGDVAYVLAPYHLVRPRGSLAANVRVRFFNEVGPEVLGPYDAERFARARVEHDLAVLRVKGPKMRFRFERLLDAVRMTRSDPVYAVGYPARSEGWDVLYSPGYVSEYTASNLKVQSPIMSAGYTGGALIDAESKVVGMILGSEGTTTDVLRIDFALQAARLFGFSIGVREPTGRSEEPKAIPGGTKQVNDRDGLAYVWIPPGQFTRGDGAGANRSRQINITKGFWIGETEVTQEAYRKVTGKSPSHFAGLQRPVEMVSWSDAEDFCIAAGMRLPTEGEWEYAAADARVDGAWHEGNSKSSTHEVKGKPPNKWGLHDMLGNVWEWASDWYDQYYYQRQQNDPRGPASGDERVLLGGGWFVAPTHVAVSQRSKGKPDARSGAIGFRCAGGEIKTAGGAP